MAEKTSISWTDATWSPWEGCTKVGPGCDHCYAEGMNRWLRKGVNWGPGATRRTYSDAHWQKPLRWNDKAKAEGKRLRVFPSVCDPFDNEVDPAWRSDLFALIADTPNLDWLLLTKRIGNAAAMMREALDGRVRDIGALPLPNVWLGATVVNQEEADRDIPKLLAVPARVRFLSIEPMLSAIDLRPAWLGWKCCVSGTHANGGTACGDCDPCIGAMGRQFVDWVIVGGESGRQARPAELEWMRSVVNQCKAADVPMLVKQLGQAVLDTGMSSPGGHWPTGTVRKPIPRRTNDDPAFVVALKDKKGGDCAEWPEDLRVREFP